MRVDRLGSYFRRMFTSPIYWVMWGSALLVITIVEIGAGRAEHADSDLTICVVIFATAAVLNRLGHVALIEVDWSVARKEGDGE